VGHAAEFIAERQADAGGTGVDAQGACGDIHAAMTQEGAKKAKS
jgi:hypothetical protein